MDHAKDIANTSSFITSRTQTMEDILYWTSNEDWWTLTLALQNYDAKYIENIEL